MEYKESELLKQSEKSTVYLIRSGGQRYVRKILTGQHPVYEVLRDSSHPGLPKLEEVVISEDSTTVIEEYIEGQSVGAVKLSRKQFSQIVRELCSVLRFLHGKGIIHRDIKPSNIILTKDGHVRLIDFDIARLLKEDREQDTRQLGTRGFAPPEQYGFAQTDGRTDIYALGVTLKQLLTEENRRPHYKRVLRKCTNPDPDKRYQSAEELRRALFPVRRNILLGCGALCMVILTGICVGGQFAFPGGDGTEAEDGASALTVLSSPGNPHWDGETGIMTWDNVPESGSGDEVWFYFKMYKKDTDTPPDPDDDDQYFEGKLRIGGSSRDAEIMEWSAVTYLEGNGFYYFAIAAAGDGIRYGDSPYVVSDAFEYTGETAPPLPMPEGLAWKLQEEDNVRRYYATWSNLDSYGERDMFNVTFYDETGAYVMNNMWSMEQIRSRGQGGISIPAEFLVWEPGREYRFTVQVFSSRPNEYGSSPMSDPPAEEYLSPPLQFGPKE